MSSQLFFRENEGQGFIIRRIKEIKTATGELGNARTKERHKTKNAEYGSAIWILASW